MHNRHIQTIIFMIFTCPALELLSSDHGWPRASTGNSDHRPNAGDTGSVAGSTGSYAIAYIPVFAHRASPDTADEVITGEPTSWCARMCACLYHRANRRPESTDGEDVYSER